jgi:hypothetical protein
MDKEFHFYITYIIAQRAGFSDGDSYKIAYSSQYTDDNKTKFFISGSDPDPFEAYISQTIDITQPQTTLMRIYPAFHFMPGAEQDLFASSAYRHDGKLHLLNTIPNNSNSIKVLRDAMGTGNLYRIGIAVHMYADTFAHQNHLGYNDSFNSLIGLSPLNIGHAEAGHKPDWPAAIWDDHRLVSSLTRVDNKRRFLQAVQYTYSFLKQGATPDQNELNQIVADIDKAIGKRDDNNQLTKIRVKEYKKLINNIKDYDEDEWINKAVEEKQPDAPLPDSPYVPTYVWKHGYKTSDWYQFQMAVKEHQKFVVDEILKPIFAKMEAII